MAGKPIPAGAANDMISAYIGYMTALGVDMNNQTQSVSFTSSVVMSWLNTVMPRADELRIFMGLYLPDHVKAGRTTVILWPYKNGQPLQVDPMELEPSEGGDKKGGGGPTYPFNEGQGNP